MNFISDSCATKPIVDKEIILSKFEKSNGEVIKYANKNSSADIKIDGRDDLISYSGKDNDRLMKLSNLIFASNVGNKLISLRGFDEQALGI